MAHTDNFRQQHEELFGIVTRIVGQLDAGALAGDASTVRADLSELTGKLTVHLSMEDKMLYPRMLGSSSDEAKQAAEKFQSEMGGLAGAYKDFNSKWITPESIQGDPNGFITEMNGIVEALKDRVQRENTILYPLADSI